MTKSYKIIIALVITLILLFNSVSVFAISSTKNSKENTMTSSTFVKSLITSMRNIKWQKNFLKNKKIENEELSEEDFEIQFDNVTAQTEEKSSTNFVISFIKKLFKKNNTTSKDTLATYIKSFLGEYLELTGDNEYTLAEALTSTGIEWTKEDIKTLIWQLLKAVYKTTSAIPNKDDMNDLVTQLTNGEYYTLDKNENGEFIEDDEEIEYTNIQDIARFCNYTAMGYGNSELMEGVYKFSKDEIRTDVPLNAPISIGKALVSKQGKEAEEVYLVALAGTAFAKGQSSGIVSDILSGIESNEKYNTYLRYTLEAINSTIPANSNIMLAGFSLGGMIAQQVMVNDNILDKYKIVQVTLLGCPALMVEEREEKFKEYGVEIPINRVIDTYDIIPYLCVDYLTNDMPQEINENLYDKDTGGYEKYKTGIGRHFLGYLKEDIWKKYDALGYKVIDDYGNNISARSIIKLKHENFKYFEAPAYYLPDAISAVE